MLEGKGEAPTISDAAGNGDTGSLPVEIAFLEPFGISRAQLRRAARIAEDCGITADIALLAEGLLSAPQFYELLAEHLGVAYLHGPLPVADGVPLDRSLAAEMVHLAPNAAGYAIALAPRGKTLAGILRQFVAQTWTGNARVVITTPRRLAALVRLQHREAIVREATHGLPDWNPRLSARSGTSLGQQLFGFGLGFAIAAGFATAPFATAQAICLALSVLFLAMVAVRLAATLASGVPMEAPMPRIPDHLLPIYTIVVPLYREGRVVPRLVKALSQLDYPVLGSKLTKV